MLDLTGRLLGSDVGVRVVLGHAADPGQAVHHTGLLVAVDRAELEEPQRQFAVGPSAGLEDQVVHRAVHRLEVVVRSLELHRREHRLLVVRQVPRGVEQALLGDVRSADVLEARLDVPAPDVVLHLALDHPALGMEDGQAGAQFVREAEEVELGAELAMIAFAGFLQPGLVGLERFAAGPGGAVEALQLLVVLITAPVRRGVAGERERRDVAGVRHVRTPAEILPGNGIVPPEVVVDGELSGADLDTGPVVVAVAGLALVGDQLQLVRLGCELGARLVVGHRPPAEPLPFLDDLGHRLLELAKIIRGEGLGQVEVVVEAVGDRRPDAELRLGVSRLDGLGGDVRGGVPEDVQPLRAVDHDRLDDVAVAHRQMQVARLAVDPSRDDGPIIAEEIQAGRGLLGHLLRTHAVANNGDRSA